MKFFTLFSGFGGVDIGLSAACHQSVGGIEYDDKIASVARMNGLHITTANVLTAVPDDYPDFDWLHASPPCPNFSTAKANNEEQPEDIALAEAVARWIITKLPRIVTLENVYQYRNSQSWVTIAQAMHNHGYLFNYWHVNMADYGVPQTRKRMIVIARRDGTMPQLPPATHAENPVNGLFGTLQRWVGWYEAIEDLIPTLPDRELTNRHNRIDIKSINEPVLITNQNNRETKEPQLVRLSGKFSLTAQSLMGWRYVDNSKYEVKKVSDRCFARFQSFPDWYDLPDNKSLACRGIGNAVPPLFMQRLGEWIL